MKTIISILLFLLSWFGSAQELLVKFNVNSGSFDRIDCPVSIDFSSIQYEMEPSAIQLVEIIGDAQKIVPSQLDNEKNKLWFILEGTTPRETTRFYAIVKKTKIIKRKQIKILKVDGALQLNYEKNPILNYQFEMTHAPKGVDEKYKKSGFLHPVYSPGGEVLTRIQPPDHYHHYGIWGPWTRTQIDGRQVDFWNLAEGQGTVLFKEFLNETQGDVYSGFTALQEHIDFGASDQNRTAINEALEVKVWNLGTKQKSWLVDYSTTIESTLENGILFETYTYGGGIGFRATEKWDKDNTSVITSEKKDRSAADGSSAKWVIVEGESATKEGRSGILFMGFPENKEFPEPMRVWPLDANEGRGDVFFEFCPIRNVEWKLEGNQQYQLKYRMLIFDGVITAEEAEIQWQAFGNPPKIIITTNK